MGKHTHPIETPLRLVTLLEVFRDEIITDVLDATPAQYTGDALFQGAQNFQINGGVFMMNGGNSELPQDSE